MVTGQRDTEARQWRIRHRAGTLTCWGAIRGDGRLPDLGKLSVDGNPITSPPPLILSLGTSSIMFYLQRLCEAEAGGELKLTGLELPSLPLEIAELQLLTAVDVSGNKLTVRWRGVGFRVADAAVWSAGRRFRVRRSCVSARAGLATVGVLGCAAGAGMGGLSHSRLVGRECGLYSSCRG